MKDKANSNKAQSATPARRREMGAVARASFIRTEIKIWFLLLRRIGNYHLYIRTNVFPGHSHLSISGLIVTRRVNSLGITIDISVTEMLVAQVVYTD